MSSKRVLVVASDVLPLPGFPTTGAGLRAWGLGKGLESRGHEVIFAMPALFLNRGEKEAPPEIAEFAWHVDNVRRVIRKAQPDVVVFCHWPTVPAGPKLGIPTVIDFHGPHLMEREMQGHGQRASNVQDKLRAIGKGDFFTCAGEKQRLYFLGWLVAAGIEIADDAITPIPVSLSPDLPEHEWLDGEPTFVYGGVFLPWQDPFNGLEVLVETLMERERGTLRFFGGRHPGYAEVIGNLERFDALVERLRRSPRVQMEGMVDHDRLIQEYRRAHVALDVMGRNPERELAFTTRTVEYMWCGLPVIYHDYAELSGYIEEYEAGWVVNPDDTEGIRRVIEETLDSPEEVRRRGENAQQLVREHLTWDRAIEPLDAFCRAPIERPAKEPRPAKVTGALPGTEGFQSQVTHIPPEAKDLRSLVGEAVHHYRYGGLRTLVHYTLGYLQKRLDHRRREDPTNR